MDTDRSGLISLSELEAGVTQLGIEFGRKSEWDRGKGRGRGGREEKGNQRVGRGVRLHWLALRRVARHRRASSEREREGGARGMHRIEPSHPPTQSPSHPPSQHPLTPPTYRRTHPSPPCARLMRIYDVVDRDRDRDRQVKPRT
jgi:hypothetical protein